MLIKQSSMHLPGSSHSDVTDVIGCPFIKRLVRKLCTTVFDSAVLQHHSSRRCVTHLPKVPSLVIITELIQILALYHCTKLILITVQFAESLT